MWILIFFFRPNRSKNNSSSSGANRTDSDNVIDNSGMLFENDSNSGSNLSLNSIDSSRNPNEITEHRDISDKNQYNR